MTSWEEGLNFIAEYKLIYETHLVGKLNALLYPSAPITTPVRFLSEFYEGLTHGKHDHE
jgi:hypothetical protein